MMAWLGAGLCCLAILIGWGPERSPGSGRHGHGGRRSEPAPPVELVLDLAASLLGSGLPVGRVLEILGARIPACSPLCSVARCLALNMDWEQAWAGSPPWLQPLQRALALTHDSGAGAAALLRNLAVLERRERSRRAQEIGAQFGTKLVLPLGLCALPAFIALGVVPVIIALLPHW